MKIVRADTKGFTKTLAEITGRGEADTTAVEAVVREIVDTVRTDGDAALLSYATKFDKVTLKRSELRVKRGELTEALASIPGKDRKILELAAERIRKFHECQVDDSWAYEDEDGTVLGQMVTPIEKVGIYVPGGKAVYPSTVLMNAVPARAAGVKKIYMVTPAGKRGINRYVLAAAKIAGVDAVFRTGGAQAVAALAYGTKIVPKVDKIVGPGNIYVATAKRLVFGTVDIDMIAGPSEILVINDGTGKASWIAADLLAQAEHDELAASVLITTSRKMAEAVKREVAKQLKKLKRRKIAEASIEKYGVIIVVKSLKAAVGISNEIAPEHLELFVEEPFELLDSIKNAGAIFLGPNTPEAVGDYLAGPNHTLPTGGTARFSSPLGVEDFIKRSSLIGFTKKGFKGLAPSVERFANLEGLGGHARSAAIRVPKKK
ncbi:MAG: histidinol dehydrogenase [Thermodesulfobacteriota bacterium]